MDLSPEILQSTSRLELYARKVVDGFMSGGNRSIRAGMGMEFKQFRNYQPGDDIRQFDWKMYARSGRYYIRESEVSSDVSIHILLDGSASMGFAYDRWNKFDYCKVITL
ncbi:MAG: DUF58 domain-containing protein, partial [Cyclobacteriaceae bacterium]|nr:DUF58 domain-containing protein [Cyclobacteriaceae bacterium]